MKEEEIDNVEEGNLLTEEEIDDGLILSSSKKIYQIYEKAKDGKVRIGEDE